MDGGVYSRLHLENPALTPADVATAYDLLEISSDAPAGVYTVTATFQNVTDHDQADIYIQVVTLTGGDLLLNSDGGPAGAGAILTAPGHVVPPGDTFQVAFQIGLQARANFIFTVGAYGVDPVTNQTVNISPKVGGFTFTAHDFSYSFFLPAVRR